MKSNEIESILLFFPLCLGMLGAFLAAKKGKQQSRSQTMSESIWHGYSVGSYVCIMSYIISGIIVKILVELSLLAPVGLFFIAIIVMGFLSFLLGLILYLPCAFFGYNLYARKLAEEEIARTQQQILKEIEAEKCSEQQSVSKD